MECPEAFEYLDDMDSFYHELEYENMGAICWDYIAGLNLGLDEGFRAFTIHLLIRAQGELKYWDEVVYQAVSIMDRFLSRVGMPMKKSDIVVIGLGALHIALKYHEIHTRVASIVAASGYVSTSKYILDMEKIILKFLEFDVWIPTPLSFMPKLLRDEHLNRETEVLAYTFLDTCLTDHALLVFPPSVIAAAAIHTAANFYSSTYSILFALFQFYDHRLFQIWECSEWMLKSYQLKPKTEAERIFLRDHVYIELSTWQYNPYVV